MSSREKKLLIIFTLGGLLVVNILLFSLYNQKKTQLEGELSAAEAEFKQVSILQKSASQFAGEIEWLKTNEPEPAAYQTVQTELQQYISTQASNFGLESKEDFLATDTSGKFYNRVQVEVKLTGKEAALYRWFHAINDPAAFRAAFKIVLKPNSQEDTLIDCTAIVAQWFKPIEDEL